MSSENSHKMTHSTKFLPTLQEPSVSFKDIGGMEKILESVCTLLMHLRHPEIHRQIGISPPKGFLLYGPSGCGKTLLANAIAGEIGVPLLNITGTELVAGVLEESKNQIRKLFKRALCSTPCIILFDEIDAITPNRQNDQEEMKRQIVAQLLSCLDDLSQNECGDMVVVIGATNRPTDAIDPALRRAGRFDREVCLGIPDKQSRVQILKVLTSKLKLDYDIDFEELAQHTSGYVGADLMSLTREATMAAANRMMDELEQRHSHLQWMAAERILKEKQKLGLLMPGDVKHNSPLEYLMMWLHDPSPSPIEDLWVLRITMYDFNNALKRVLPIAKREGFAMVPDISWDDIGSLTSVKEELQMAILAPIKHVEHSKELGLNTPTSVLLCGPPGCGKTLIAKAMANEAGFNFIPVKGSELLNMYVGESEKAVRLCFERAQNCAPCFVFFDELDAICPKSSDTKEGEATMRVVNQMLTQIDGVQDRRGVYLLAASTRPDIIDPAVLRPGRFNKILFVGLPTANDRIEILRAITKNGTKPLLAYDVDLEAIATSEQCWGYTGADLATLVKEAATVASKKILRCGNMQKFLVVRMEHFTKALAKIRPSVSKKDQKLYDKLQKIYSAVPDQKAKKMKYF